VFSGFIEACRGKIGVDRRENRRVEGKKPHDDCGFREWRSVGIGRREGGANQNGGNVIKIQ
jgi:hypothetical protein